MDTAEDLAYKGEEEGKKETTPNPVDMKDSLFLLLMVQIQAALL